MMFRTLALWSILCFIGSQTDSTPPPRSRWVVMSVNDNYQYSFLMPLTALLWERMGYQSLFLVMASQEVFPPDLSLACSIAEEVGARIIPLQPNGEFGSAWYQTARLFGAAVDSLGDDLRNDSYLITSDVDMWPINASWFQAPFDDPNKPVHWFGWPYAMICYLGATVSEWRKIMHLDQNGNIEDQMARALDSTIGRTADSEQQWTADQVLLEKRLMEFELNSDWERVQFIKRNASMHMPPFDRLDRAYDADWHQGTSLTGYIDAHVPLNDSLPAWVDTDGYQWWRWQRLLLVKLLLSTDELDWVDEYFEAFDALEHRRLKQSRPKGRSDERARGTCSTNSATRECIESQEH